MKQAIAGIAAVLWVPAAALANDKWDGVITNDSIPTQCVNQLLNGTRQTHDLEGNGDIDYMIVAVKTGHSYEAVMDSPSADFDADQVNGFNPRMERTDSAGTTIQSAVAPDGTWPPGAPTISPSLVLRWTAAADEFQLIRVSTVLGQVPAEWQYDVLFRETTYAIPRWNNSATQVTVFVIQNTSSSAVTGSVRFYNPAGTLLHSEPISLAARGVVVFNTAGLAPLAGQGGSALVSHDAGYGQLSGKAVAVEPASGFTFDTAMDTIRY